MLERVNFVGVGHGLYVDENVGFCKVRFGTHLNGLYPPPPMVALAIRPTLVLHMTVFCYQNNIYVVTLQREDFY